MLDAGGELTSEYLTPSIQHFFLMELPIYQENLRSSGDWRADLANVRVIWEQIQSDAAALGKFRAQQMQTLRNEADTQALANAANLISTWLNEANAEFNLARLLELNRTLTNNENLFRQTEATPLNEAHDPPLAIMLPRLLENAMGWFATEGFAEMNAVEQAALVYLRLLDLQPFATANQAMATLAASFYLERAGLPPLIFDVNDPKYTVVLVSAFRMLTQHLVEYFAAALQNNLRQD